MFMKASKSDNNIQVGDFYEDCAYHPVICTEVRNETTICGASLVDGSMPRSCDIHHCGVIKLSTKQAFSLLTLWQTKGKKYVEDFKERQYLKTKSNKSKSDNTKRL